MNFPNSFPEELDILLQMVPGDKQYLRLKFLCTLSDGFAK